MTFHNSNDDNNDPPPHFPTLAWRSSNRTQPFRGPAIFPAICSLWTRLLRTVPSPCQCRSTSETQLESVLYAVNFKGKYLFHLFRSKLSLYIICLKLYMQKWKHTTIIFFTSEIFVQRSSKFWFHNLHILHRYIRTWTA